MHSEWGKTPFGCTGYAGVFVVFFVVASLAFKGSDTVIVFAALYAEIVVMTVLALKWTVSGRVAVDTAFVGEDLHHFVEGFIITFGCCGIFGVGLVI